MSGTAKAAPGKDVEAQKNAPNYGGVAPMPTPPLVVRKPKDSTLIVWVLGFLLFLGIGATITMLVISIDVSPFPWSPLARPLRPLAIERNNSSRKPIQV